MQSKCFLNQLVLLKMSSQGQGSCEMQVDYVSIENLTVIGLRYGLSCALNAIGVSHHFSDEIVFLKGGGLTVALWRSLILK